MLAEDAVDGRLRGDVDAALGQNRDDLIRRQVTEFGVVDDLEDVSFFVHGQLVRGRGLATSATVLADALPFPALDRARIDLENFTGLGLASSGGDGLVDEAQDQVALVVRVLPSSSPQSSWTFLSPQQNLWVP
jgi:hypothetical protein